MLNESEEFFDVVGVTLANINREWIRKTERVKVKT
jgi:hypothetical protein